jgi:hypothetical protein
MLIASMKTTNMTFGDFLQATYDLSHPKKKPRAGKDATETAKPFIAKAAKEAKGTPGDNPANIASQAWRLWKKKR